MTTLIPIDASYRCTFIQIILTESLLSSSAPLSSSREDGFTLTQEAMIHRYLPYTAKTQSVVENAKVAILLDVLLRMLLATDNLVWSPALENAVERGIAARKKRGVSFRNASGKDKEDTAAIRLQWNVAEETLRLVVKVARAHHDAGGSRMDDIS